MSPRAEVAPAVAVATTTTRVRYPETDRMGVAHHTHYLVWFELGRTELMRELGCAYGELEERDGVFFPVVRVAVEFRAPARYDEEIRIDTRLTSVGGVRVRFDYELHRVSDGTRLAVGHSEHASIDAGGRPRRLPGWLRARLSGNPEPAS